VKARYSGCSPVLRQSYTGANPHGEFGGHIPGNSVLGPGFRLRRKRPVSASARFTNDSSPNGRPVRVWSRSSSISLDLEERDAFQSSIPASGPRLYTRGSFSMSPIGHRALYHW